MPMNMKAQQKSKIRVPERAACVQTKSNPKNRQCVYITWTLRAVKYKMCLKKAAQRKEPRVQTKSNPPKHILMCTWTLWYTRFCSLGFSSCVCFFLRPRSCSKQEKGYLFYFTKPRTISLFFCFSLLFLVVVVFLLLLLLLLCGV